MLKSFTFFLSLLYIVQVQAQEAKILAECTVVYDLTVENAKADPGQSMTGVTKTVYIKGSKARADLFSKAFQQVVIYDGKSDTTIILRELGNTKYISYVDMKKRAEQNKKYEGMTIDKTNETKTILGYECKKALATLRDGSVYTVYYAPSIVPSNKLFEFQFRELPGFVLEYEALSEDGKNKVRYTASKITLTPVPEAKFDIPTSGYRVL